MNNFYKSPEQWMADHRDELIRLGDLYRTSEGKCRLTNQGEERILELLIRLVEDPGSLLLLEQWYSERLEAEGPLSQHP